MFSNYVINPSLKSLQIIDFEQLLLLKLKEIYGLLTKPNKLIDWLKINQKNYVK